MKRLALIFVVLMGQTALAEEAVDDLIKQLDAPNFLKREEAANKLEKLGQTAIPALKNAAAEGTAEAAVRAIGILKTLQESDDKPTAEAAKSALKELAQSKNAATARRAKNALTPKSQPQDAPQLPRLAPGIPLARNVVIQNNAQRITTRTVNGVKTVEVTTGQRELKIVDDPNKGITVEITEPKNGKKTTEKFEAKNADELKKKHPQAYEDYKKYAQGNAVRIQVGGAGIPFGPRAAQRRMHGQRLKMAGRMLKSMMGHVDRLIDEATIKNADNTSREALQKDLAEMRKQITALEKKLQASTADAEAKEKTRQEANKPEETQPKTEN